MEIGIEQKQFKECLKECVEKESELQACPSINADREALIPTQCQYLPPPGTILRPSARSISLCDDSDNGVLD